MACASTGGGAVVADQASGGSRSIQQIGISGLVGVLLCTIATMRCTIHDVLPAAMAAGGLPWLLIGFGRGTSLAMLAANNDALALLMVVSITVLGRCWAVEHRRGRVASTVHALTIRRLYLPSDAPDRERHQHRSHQLLNLARRQGQAFQSDLQQQLTPERLAAALERARSSTHKLEPAI